MNTTAAVYLRVSTESQTVENQRAPLVAACAARGLTPRFYEETESAAKRRPVFDSMMAAAHRGDVGAVVVAALDRLGRSLAGVLDTITKLDAAGVRVVSLRESWLDTSGPHRSLLVAIFAWVAETERGVLIERTRAGIARARRQGKHIGRPRADSEQLRRALSLVSAGTHSPAQAADVCGVSARTLKRRLGTGATPHVTGQVDRSGEAVDWAAKTPPSVPPPADVPPQG
jgi:putative DNA-invertase from lambdoid prophage Rac